MDNFTDLCRLEKENFFPNYFMDGLPYGASTLENLAKDHIFFNHSLIFTAYVKADFDPLFDFLSQLKKSEPIFVLNLPIPVFQGIESHSKEKINDWNKQIYMINKNLQTKFEDFWNNVIIFDEENSSINDNNFVLSHLRIEDIHILDSWHRFLFPGETPRTVPAKVVSVYNENEQIQLTSGVVVGFDYIPGRVLKQPIQDLTVKLQIQRQSDIIKNSIKSQKKSQQKEAVP